MYLSTFSVFVLVLGIILCCVSLSVQSSDGNVVASFDRRGQFIITGNSRGKVSYVVRIIT